MKYFDAHTYVNVVELNKGRGNAIIANKKPENLFPRKE